jgi:hypothetical protein
MKNNIFRLTGLILFVVGASSCASARIEKQEVRLALHDVIKENIFVLRKLDRIDCIRSFKYENKQLDDRSNQFILNYTDSLRSLVLEHIRTDSQVVMRRIKHRSVDSLTIRIAFLKKRLKEDLDNINLFDSLLATNTYNQFDIASFFNSGEFQMDVTAEPFKVMPFLRVVEDLLHFASKFPGKKLNGSILVLGYADAQQITPGSTLDSILRQSLGSTDSVPSPVLNKELSRLRAVTVAQVLSGVYGQKTEGGKIFPGLSVEYIPQGRGEEYPNPKIRNYQVDDERRRVVLVYWSILPDFD